MYPDRKILQICIHHKKKKIPYYFFIYFDLQAVVLHPRYSRCSRRSDQGPKHGQVQCHTVRSSLISIRTVILKIRNPKFKTNTISYENDQYAKRHASGLQPSRTGIRTGIHMVRKNQEIVCKYSWMWAAELEDGPLTCTINPHPRGCYTAFFF